MANTFSTKGHIHTIDTLNANLVVSQTLKVRSIRWVSKGATAGDDVKVTAEDDTVLWESVASGSNYVEESLINADWIGGFKVPVLDSGKLYITLQVHPAR